MAVAILAASTLTFAGLWISERGRADDLAAKQNRATEAKAQAARARPNLMRLADAVDHSSDGVEYSGGADSLDVEIPSPDDYTERWLTDYLKAVGLPSATIDRMAQTRALDGTLEAHAGHVSVTWTYHPDDGLSAVFSVD